MIDINLIRSYLENKEFESLLGEFENEWLECKRQPYDLLRDDQKLELAKDVTGLANAGGGLLILGYSTKRSDTHGDDQIDEIRAFPEEQFIQAQYESVLATWIYPPLDDLKITKIPIPSKPTSIIVMIDIPKVIGSNRPALVAKSIIHGTRKIETLVGYFSRKQSHVAHYDVKRIQAMFRDGLRYDEDIRDNFSALHSAIESLRGQTINPTPIISDDEVQSNMQQALLAMQLEGKPAIVLTAIPTRSLNLIDLFESTSSELVRLIEFPPVVRSAGFNLRTGERSKIIDGKIRRAIDVGFRMIEVHRNGSIIFVASGGRDGLCWGRDNQQQESLLINQIALIEMIYLFCIFYQKVHSSDPQENEEFHIGVDLLHLSLNGKPARLEPGLPDSFPKTFYMKPAPKDSMSIKCKINSSTTPERAAFLLLSEIYNIFGFETDKIPLMTRAAGQEKCLDRDELSQLG